MLCEVLSRVPRLERFLGWREGRVATGEVRRLDWRRVKMGHNTEERVSGAIAACIDGDASGAVR
jgi:hypothetical protein